MVKEGSIDCKGNEKRGYLDDVLLGVDIRIGRIECGDFSIN